MESAADREIVIRVRRGDLEAYGELVRRYQQSVFNVCYRVLRNMHDAEDVAQEALLRGFERLHSYDIERPFGPWIRRVAANLAINHLRSRQTLFELDEEHDEQQPEAQPEASLILKERTTDILEALSRLPAQYRVAIELCHFHGLSYEQLAEALALPVNTARSHLFRGRRLLARYLSER